MTDKQYAKIMTAIAMNSSDREYNQLEHFMRRFLQEDEE